MTADIRITDSSLRDGSHAKRHQFTVDEVTAVVAALDAAGVPVIEVTHGDGLGGSSFTYGLSRTPEQELIKAAVRTATRAKIAFLMLPGIGLFDDIRAAAGNGATVCRIASHCTEADITEQHFGLARKLGLETVGFLMMAHSQPPEALAAQAVPVGHLDHRDARRVQGRDHRRDLVDGELVAFGVRAVAQRGVGDPDVGGHLASSSPTRHAAAVMMSRFPAYGGRKSPAPLISTKTATRPSWNCGSFSSR